jgi:hypothetical protein
MSSLAAAIRQPARHRHRRVALGGASESIHDAEYHWLNGCFIQGLEMVSEDRQSRSVRILIEPSDYVLRNTGDMAMLRTAVIAIDPRQLWQVSASSEA